LIFGALEIRQEINFPVQNITGFYSRDVIMTQQRHDKFAAALAVSLPFFLHTVVHLNYKTVLGHIENLTSRY
jgi:hypothetical protein